MQVDPRNRLLRAIVTGLGSFELRNCTTYLLTDPYRFFSDPNITIRTRTCHGLFAGDAVARIDIVGLHTCPSGETIKNRAATPLSS